MLIVALVAFYIASYGQVKYTIVKVAYTTVNPQGVANAHTYSAVSKRFDAYLYNNALVFDDSGNTNYMFARKIGMPQQNIQRWNATDRAGGACEITVEDRNTYTLIGIRYLDSNKIMIYQTL